MGQPHVAQTHLAQPHRSGELLSYICAPENFGIVESGVYRSNALYAANFPFVKRLKLKTVIYLSPEAPIRAVTQFLEETNTQFIRLGLEAWKPYVTWKPISEELIKDALEIVLDVRSHPIMIMCASGIHHTGTLVGCLRRLQQWNLTALVEEYRRFAGSKARYVNEQFMELFDDDLVTLPEHLPPWFIDQRTMMEEEMLECERLNGEEEQKALQSLVLSEGCWSGSENMQDEEGKFRADDKAASTPRLTPSPASPSRLTSDADPEMTTTPRKNATTPSLPFLTPLQENSVETKGAENKKDSEGQTSTPSPTPPPRSEVGDSSQGNKKYEERKSRLPANEPSTATLSSSVSPSYLRFYFSRNSPLTTEGRSYKRKIIGKTDVDS
eukprot:TRINITY_DN23544_c0_g1_i1.p1 TRINITY_DN23544_c0_g1~~TRINITY_DN23544_c0_g1_i1.p1  ORF type:complete len:383 (-),score=33.46 TRINITY_DN23544_c0_g1_i1:330-1478(-)